jgi:Cof subfamily protein (haloacid dehalogenase superfamily)
MSRLSFRLAAIDLDGTLLGPDKEISPANFAAVRSLQSAGVRVILASGRKHENMTRFHRSLGLEGPIVSSQGALVKHAETGEILFQRFLTSELAFEMARDCQAAGMSLLYYLEDGIHVSKLDAYTAIYQSRGGDELTVSSEMHLWTDCCPQKVIWLGSPEHVSAHFPGVERRYRGRSDTLISEPEYLEFMASGVSKAVGVAAVADNYGIAAAEVITLGDGNNDVSMLEWAGLGVAMSQSTPAAKAAADRVAPEGDPADSFARAVAEILG